MVYGGFCLFWFSRLNWFYDLDRFFSTTGFILSVMGLVFHNDIKHGMQYDTQNLIGSAIMKVVFKPIKFRLTSHFLHSTSLKKVHCLGMFDIFEHKMCYLPNHMTHHASDGVTVTLL